MFFANLPCADTLPCALHKRVHLMRLAILERVKTADTGVKLKLPPSTLNTFANSNMLLMQITHPKGKIDHFRNNTH